MRTDRIKILQGGLFLHRPPVDLKRVASTVSGEFVAVNFSHVTSE